jgi:hypothetical protein
MFEVVQQHSAEPLQTVLTLFYALMYLSLHLHFTDKNLVCAKHIQLTAVHAFGKVY